MRPQTLFTPRMRCGAWFAACFGAGLIVGAAAVSARAQTLPHREPPEGELRLGQRVYIDDGSCPAGQIKQVTGARLTPNGVVRERECVARKVRR